MADDLDVEALLEAPFKKETGEPDNGKATPPDDKEKDRHKRKDRSSRSRSKSPRRRRRSGSRGKDRSRRRSRSRSRDHRRGSRSRDSRRGGGLHRDRRSRDKRRSRSPEKRRSRSSERVRRNRSRSPRKPIPKADTNQRQNKQPDAETIAQNDQRSRRHNPPASEPKIEASPQKAQPASPVPARVPRVPSPDPEPPSEDRDHRTVMCMQLSARVTSKELENFFGKIGQVREVKMIADKNSRKSKGIAYVEFFDEKSVPGALQMTGQKLFGIPMIVQPTMAEKNKLAAQAQNLKKAEGPRKLYVGSLHYNINEDMLRAVFEPFGQIDKIIVQRDEAGISRGYGFVEFKDSESAEKAMSNLNGFELAGRAIKVNHVTERDTPVVDSLDADDADMGIGMTPQSRAALMAKLAEGHNAGLTVPQLTSLPVPAAPVASNCFFLSNMFDPTRETEPNWDADIKDDVYEECAKYGGVLHIFVDKFSQGNVYVKCVNAQVAAAASNALNGRFFAGKKIVAQFIPEGTYNVKFPSAITNTYQRS